MNFILEFFERFKINILKALIWLLALGIAIVILFLPAIIICLFTSYELWIGIGLLSGFILMLGYIFTIADMEILE